VQHHALRDVQADLERIDHDYVGKVGTNKAFLYPDEYSSVMAMTQRQRSQRQKLGRHHVVVSEKLLPHVMEVIRGLPHKENVRVKEQDIIAYLIPDGDSLLPVTTRATFLQASRHPQVDSRSVVSQ